MKAYFLKPGELYAANDDTEITTLLGSCIAVCIWDRRRHIGGMCHYYLPYALRSEVTPNHYGEIAIVNLMRQLKKLGCDRRDLEAKILGGARVVEEIKLRNFDIGTRNTDVAQETLERYRIPIVARNVGGTSGRKVRFYTNNGLVRFSMVSETHMASPSNSPIKVLIVDDSKPVRMLLRRMIEEDKQFTVMAEAADAQEAGRIMAANEPDVITLDIRMPGMDGITFLGQYMRVKPIPTVMISSLNPLESAEVFRALELGAFDYIQKPSLADFADRASGVRNILAQAAQSRQKMVAQSPGSQVVVRETLQLSDAQIHGSIIAIGASTGGTEAIRCVLERLPARIPPIVIVQHIPNAFSRPFAERLNQLCAMRVVEAEQGQLLEAGTAYIAPGDRHFIINNCAGVLRVHLTDEPPVNRFRPSVDVMFRSVAAIPGRRIVAAILTGMGSDGAYGLLDLKNRGAHTIAQNESSSIVDGMPRVARELGAAKEVAALDLISQRILRALA